MGDKSRWDAFREESGRAFSELRGAFSSLFRRKPKTEGEEGLLSKAKDRAKGFGPVVRDGGEKLEEATRKLCSSEKLKETGEKIAEESRECLDACKRTGDRLLSKFRRKP